MLIKRFEGIATDARYCEKGLLTLAEPKDVWEGTMSCARRETVFRVRVTVIALDVECE